MSLLAKRVSIKQCEDPESTNPVAETDGQEGKEMGINKESGSERAAVLSRTFHSHVPPELAQPLNSTESKGLLTLLPAWY